MLNATNISVQTKLASKLWLSAKIYRVFTTSCNKVICTCISTKYTPPISFDEHSFACLSTPFANLKILLVPRLLPFPQIIGIPQKYNNYDLNRNINIAQRINAGNIIPKAFMVCSNLLTRLSVSSTVYKIFRTTDFTHYLLR